MYSRQPRQPLILSLILMRSMMNRNDRLSCHVIEQQGCPSAWIFEITAQVIVCSMA